MTVTEHLRRLGILVDGSECSVAELTGGVSGEVLLVQQHQRRWVVKRALPKLRVEADWTADPSRASIEAAAIETLHAITPEHTPALVHYDVDSFTVTMTAASPDWISWKAILLRPAPHGGMAAEVGARLGHVLGTWHRQTWQQPEVATRFTDHETFDQLRIDPFHRAVLSRHPAVEPAVSACVRDLTTIRQCLVHGDFSPKNVLVGPEGLWVLDFEVAHFGNPVFDLAFLQCHLLLKAFHQPACAGAYRGAATAFLTGYQAATEPTAAAGLARGARLGWHTACLLLARVDGTSPAGYLDFPAQQRVRELALAVLGGEDPPIAELWKTVEGEDR